jgi:hypothetical protein
MRETVIGCRMTRFGIWDKIEKVGVILHLVAATLRAA